MTTLARHGKRPTVYGRPLSIRFQDDTAAQLAQVAAELDVSPSELVRQYVERGLRADKRKRRG